MEFQKLTKNHGISIFLPFFSVEKMGKEVNLSMKTFQCVLHISFCMHYAISYFGYILHRNIINSQSCPYKNRKPIASVIS